MENKFLAQAYKGKTEIWRYAVGLVLAVFGSLLLAIPYNLAIANKVSLGEADASRITDASYLYTLMDSNMSLIYIMLPFVGGLFVLYLVVTKMHKLSWSSFTTSRPSIDYKRLLFSFLLWGGITALVTLLGFLINPNVVFWNFNAKSFGILFILSIVLIPIQTSFEEYLFRGYIMQALGVSTKTKWFPLLITSVVFGLLHYANPEVKELGYGIMFFYVGTGLLLGIITLMDEGMELSLGFHMANNLITALLVTADWTAFQTAALFKDFSSPSLSFQLIAIVILYPLLLLVLAKKYKWKNWKSKLI